MTPIAQPPQTPVERSQASSWSAYAEPTDEVTDLACLLCELWLDSTIVSYVNGRLRIGILTEPSPEQAERLDRYIALLSACVPWLVPVARFEGRAVLTYVGLGLS